MTARRPHGAPSYRDDGGGRVQSRYVVVDGIRTHYLEAGTGPDVVLLHGGDHGASAENAWEFTILPLAEHYRVLAPDWLGYGRTDKLHDFGGVMQRRLWHMGRFLDVMAVERAAFVGHSMGGSLLVRLAASGDTRWPIAALVLAAGGGFAPDNEARRVTLDFDGSLKAMRRQISTTMVDQYWAQDDDFVARRLATATAPGAWEAMAATRLRSPLLPSGSDFGQPDTTPYEQVVAPTLVVAGAQDRLRLPGYEEELGRRLPAGRVLVLDDCGHLPQIEKAPAFTEASLNFLGEVYLGA